MRFDSAADIALTAFAAFPQSVSVRYSLLHSAAGGGSRCTILRKPMSRRAARISFKCISTSAMQRHSLAAPPPFVAGPHRDGGRSDPTRSALHRAGSGLRAFARIPRGAQCRHRASGLALRCCPPDAARYWSTHPTALSRGAATPGGSAEGPAGKSVWPDHGIHPGPLNDTGEGRLQEATGRLSAIGSKVLKKKCRPAPRGHPGDAAPLGPCWRRIRRRRVIPRLTGRATGASSSRSKDRARPPVEPGGFEPASVCEGRA